MDKEQYKDITESSLPLSELRLLKDPESFVDEIKANPLILVPNAFFFKALEIKDPVQVICEYHPTKEDVGLIINGVIGCIPVVGALCSGIFSIFWSRANEPEESIDSKLANLKKEIMKEVDEKIKDGNIKVWRELVNSSLDGLRKTSNEMSNKLNALKMELFEGKKPSDSLKTDIRAQLGICIYCVDNFISICANDVFDNYILPQYVQGLLALTLFRRLQDAYWYQLGYSRNEAAGRYPTKDVEKGVKSFRELLHESLIAGINDVGLCLTENWLEGKDKLNENIDACPELLKNDMYLYPVPLVCMDSFPSTIEVKDNPVIYRFDAWGAPIKDGYPPGGVDPKPHFDPITGCYGRTFGHKPGFKLSFSKKCKFQIRCFGVYPRGGFLPRMWCNVDGKTHETDLLNLDFPIRSTWRGEHFIATYKNFLTGITCSPHFEGSSVKVTTGVERDWHTTREKVFFFEVVVSRC